MNKFGGAVFLSLPYLIVFNSFEECYKIMWLSEHFFAQLLSDREFLRKENYK